MCKSDVQLYMQQQVFWLELAVQQKVPPKTLEQTVFSSETVLFFSVHERQWIFAVQKEEF